MRLSCKLAACAPSYIAPSRTRTRVLLEFLNNKVSSIKM